MKLNGSRSYAHTWQIGESQWDLKFVRKLSENSLGLCDPSVNCIYIKQKQGKGEIFKTFLHEVVHSFENEYDFVIDHRIVYKLEEAFSRFFLDNLQAFARLLEEQS